MSSDLQSLSLAIISDLHCHLDIDSTMDSFLKVGALRNPPTNHPVEALLSLISKDSIQTNVLLVPGDLANKSCQEGLSHAWDLIREVGSALKSTNIIPVLGNHDVDSRRTLNNDPFYIPRNLRLNFPFEDRTCTNEFFSEGSCIIQVNPSFEIIVINTVIDHHDEVSAKRGMFKPERLSVLDQKLARRPNLPVRIAVMHHHPILHNSPVITENDVIENGDALLSILRNRRCGLIIHGHKHHARLRCVETTNGKIPIFAAGSFSSILREAGSFTRNVFHVLSIESNPNSTNLLRGILKTWEWRLGTGWIPTIPQSSDFPFVTGFGTNSTVDLLAESLQQFASSHNKIYVYPCDQVADAAPELPFLTPVEMEALKKKLLEDFGLELKQNREGLFELGKIYITKDP